LHSINISILQNPDTQSLLISIRTE
jgi:hypothetical protein